MKFPKEYLEEIKQRIKVSDIVGASVQLKRRGREFVGLSPFSKEKTPSFTINDEKGFYHCRQILISYTKFVSLSPNFNHVLTKF